MVKNNKIINQTWGVYVSMMYFPIDVSFSLPIQDADELYIEIGHELATEKALTILDSVWDGESPNFRYEFEVEEVEIDN